MEMIVILDHGMLYLQFGDFLLLQKLSLSFFCFFIFNNGVNIYLLIPLGWEVQIKT